jgi:hypothetical protein
LELPPFSTDVFFLSLIYFGVVSFFYQMSFFLVTCVLGLPLFSSEVFC